MGEEPQGTFGSLYMIPKDGGEPIKLSPPVEIDGLHLSDEDLDIRQSEPMFKPWHIDGFGSIEINLSVTLKDKYAPIVRFMERQKRRERESRVAILWAVTHGYSVDFIGIDPTRENTTVRYHVTTPREVRQLLRYSPFVPEFEIFDKNGFMCVIKKGKIKITNKL